MEQTLSVKEFFTHVVRDMAKAICERPTESKQDQFIRMRIATHMILGLQPRDVVEAMLAGHTVMFHALMTDSIHDTLQGEIDTMRRATRSNIVAMNRAFHMNLRELKKYQTRPSEGTLEASGEVRPPEAAPPTAPPRGDKAPRPEPSVPFRPSPEQIAACQANPEAMAALDTGDFARFARAMGIENPSEAYIAAATGQLGRVDGNGAGFTPQTARTNGSGGSSTGPGRLTR